MASKSLPPRWKNCPMFGDLILNTFIPFKVPLDDTYGSKLPLSKKFSPKMFTTYIKAQNIDLGLWIDLTYTNRFYDKSLVESEDIRYVKLKCRGFGECPSPDQTQLFIDICARFLNKNPDKKIAVHCTHGFNRTGFLICSYLVMQESWSVEAAIAEFSKSRPPGIYKQDYIDELFTRYGDIEDRILAPNLPDWCNEDNDYNDDGIIMNHNAPSSSNSNNINDSSFPFEGIEGIFKVEDPEKIKMLQKLCSNMCKFKLNGFPGSQPVSLTHQNIHLLQSEEYLVSWKADGTRYLMLILGPDEVYFFSRDYQVYQISNIKFLRKNLTECIVDTLVDGEMVVDVVDGKSWPRFLIYDIIYFDGEDVSNLFFRERLNIIFKKIIHPRETAKRSGVIDRTKEPIGIRQKDFCEIKDTYKYFSSKFTKVLSHEIDGLIFQPVKLHYLAGRCDKVLKWKPPSHNSVDFRLSIINERANGTLRPIGRLFVCGQQQPFDYMPVTDELRNYNNKIIECRYSMTKGQWELMRERTDKTHPNGLNTAINVCNSIKYPITRDYLLNYISKNLR